MSSTELPTHHRFQNLAGKVFGNLTVQAYAGRRGKHSLWECSCYCGNTSLVLATNLVSFKSRSCGCLRIPATVASKTTHGQTGTRMYDVWCSMRQRCNDRGHVYYHHYGGRGIKVCERWNDFAVFLADMGERPSVEHSLDREDNDGNYSKANCRWATKKEQARNRRNNRTLTHAGRSMTLPEWAEEIGILPSTLRSRFYTYGWSVARALDTPVRKQGSK